MKDLAGFHCLGTSFKITVCANIFKLSRVPNLPGSGIKWCLNKTNVLKKNML